ncbi:hypothetical protein [Frankia sp. R82]|uniref:hypothetical protein n=1 Tax=Frankia sp. R82 TaxID=2950553 RepID=UPI0020442AA7|nr:hypothetical protein [Frankia sp. R82]MCM3883365.1 hypothetical protein [Frankia sp. R82]
MDVVGGDLFPYRVLVQFNQVGTSGLDAASGIEGLVARITDKSRHSEQYVENHLWEPTAAGASPGDQSGERVGAQRSGQGRQNQPVGAQ